MTGRLLRKSPVPLYAQVKELLRERIALQRDRDHLQIPSERELSNELGVSRMTVRQAVRELISEGALFTAPGRGTFLAATEVTQELDGLTSFSQEMHRLGLVPSSRVLAADAVVDAGLAERLRIGATEPIARIRRLRLANAEPMAIETSHLPLGLCPGILGLDLDARSLYDVLKHVFKLRLGSASQRIAAQVADEATAVQLGIPLGAPVLYMERLTRLEDGRLIEFVTSWYRGDRYHFSVRLAASRKP